MQRCPSLRVSRICRAREDASRLDLITALVERKYERRYLEALSLAPPSSKWLVDRCCPMSDHRSCLDTLYNIRYRVAYQHLGVFRKDIGM